MLRIRHLLIHINTDKGVFGTRQNFADGLNIIRAENWAGKSQVVQSIMYALGLEGMQGPSHAVPLAHAMTDYLGSQGKRQGYEGQGHRFDGLPRNREREGKVPN